MAGLADTHLARLVTGHLRCFPYKRDRSPLSLGHPSHWVCVYYGACSLSFGAEFQILNRIRLLSSFLRRATRENATMK